MYCKQCGREYKNEKLCKKCGIVLSTGASPAAGKRKRRNILIATGAACVVIVAVFLIIGLTGMVPSQIKGQWYESEGLGGMIEFMPGGIYEVTVFGSTVQGAYTFNGATNEGTLHVKNPNDQSDAVTTFVYKGDTLEMDDMVFTREYVPQIDFGSALEGVLDNEE